MRTIHSGDPGDEGPLHRRVSTWTAVAAVAVSIVVSVATGTAFLMTGAASQGQANGEVVAQIKQLTGANQTTSNNIDKLVTIVTAQGNQLASLAAQVDGLQRALQIEHQERIDYENRFPIRR